jgi:outer membrane protein OmpA-like peptidoglycan-associated protein
MRLHRPFLGVILATLAQVVSAREATVAHADPQAAVTGERVHGSLDVWVDKSKVDLVQHRLEVKANRPLMKVTIKVTGDSGAVLADDSRDLLSHPANTVLAVEWHPSSDEVAARIEVFVYDSFGFYKGFALTPWNVSIPHEEVNFATDSAVINDAEKPKLEASFVKVTEALARHPEIQGVRFFIAGHTDTVGDAQYNVRLSRLRAQAIAQWFRQRGLRIPIGWEGFGEYAPLIRTADNVDEPRNRRVDYLLGIDEPNLKSATFRPSWKSVP